MKSAKVVAIDQSLKPLVDAKAIAKQHGRSVQYINRLARDGKIPWHGIRNGIKTYRRFDPDAVRLALLHEVADASA